MNCKKCGKEINSLYQMCELLTIGTRCEVYYICDMECPKLIGKKLIDKNDPEVINCKYTNFILDVNFPKYHTVINDNDNIIIIYEYIKGNSLENEMYNLSNKDFYKIICKIVDKVIKITRQHFYYLNINKTNIILKNNEPYFIDFSSLFKPCDSLINSNRLFGSKTNVPPEYSIEKRIILEKFDVFSIGLLLFEKTYQVNLFNVENYYSLNCWFWCDIKKFHSRDNCLIKFMNNQNERISEAMKYIIIKCLEFDFHKRIELEKLKMFLEINSS